MARAGMQTPQSVRIRVGAGDAATETTIPYLLFLPRAYHNGDESWPLMLYLHGADGRGTDPDLVKRNGPPKLVEAHNDFPFILVSPQCPWRGYWKPSWKADELIGLLDAVIDRYRVDPSRIYLTGYSMGGYGSWRTAFARPDYFAAMAPICGGGDIQLAHRVKDVPIWAFHGAKDLFVPSQYSEALVNAVRQAGGNARLTVYPHAAHDSWTETYDNPELYEWLLSQRRPEEVGAPLFEDRKHVA